MKKILLTLTITFAAVLASPFILYMIGSATRFTSFYATLAGKDTSACTRYYEGESRGTIWEKGEWHHYVDFKVDISAPYERWMLTDAPLPSTMWRFPSPSPDIIRASYRWPSDWRDPFPIRSWRICLLGS